MAERAVPGAPDPESGPRAEIRERVTRLIRERLGRATFVPGETPVQCSGRVYDEADVLAAVEASLDFWLTLGPYGDRFERALADRLGVRHAILTNSGSSANLLAVSALTSPKLERALQPGDEVITAAAGFPTTVGPIVQNGLVPVFVDVLPGTAVADPGVVEAAVGPRTRAVMMAHTLGNPFDLEAVVALCRRHNLWLVEDNCDALGSRYGDRPTGSFGDLATQSFYPAHHITMGEGGAVLTGTGELKVILESFRDWGRDCFPPGTSVICRDAVRPIESVEVGHEVLTHEGRWRPVIRLTGHRNYTRPMVTIRARLRPRITVSATHPFWVRRNGHQQWVQASKLHRGDELIARAYPPDAFARLDIAWAYRTLYKEAVPSTVPVEPDLMRLIGYWLAEGSLVRARRGADGFIAYRADFAFHERETEFIADVKSLMARYFGCTGWVRHDARSHGVSLSFKSRRAYEFFLQTTGRGARNKRLAPWMLELPDKHISELLRGHWRGDGSASRQGFVVHSVSAELIEQIRLLMMRLGILASQWKRKPGAHRPSVVHGKTVRATTDLHALSIYGVNAERFAVVIGERYSAKTQRRQAAMDEATGEAFFPVVDVHPFEADEPVDVYNLEVEGDNSYHAAGVVVHNCWCAPGKANTCGQRFDWELGDLPRGYDHKYTYTHVGYNLKPTDLQAAIGLSQLDKLDRFTAERRRNWDFLRRTAGHLEEFFELPEPTRGSEPSWFGFLLVVREGAPFTRDELVRALEARRVHTRMLFGGNLLRQPAFRTVPHRVVGGLAQTERLLHGAFWVGVYPGLSGEPLRYLASVLEAECKRLAAAGRRGGVTR